MNSIIIKQSGKVSCGSRTVRAYEPVAGQPDRTLGVSASTTGNVQWSALSCAAKAFIKFKEPQAERAEIETRIRLHVVVVDLIWLAELQPKEASREK